MDVSHIKVLIDGLDHPEGVAYDHRGDLLYAGGEDPAYSPNGTLYFSDPGRWKEDNGAVLAVAPDGTADVIDTRLCRFTDGCEVTPDGSELWVIQSPGPEVSRIDLRSGDIPETVVALPGTVPDGSAFTEKGGATISCYRPDRIYYVDPTGSVDIVADDPEGTLLSAPTNVCFAGGDRRKLVSANLGRWHLTLLESDVVGVAPHAPTAWAANVL